MNQNNGASLECSVIESFVESPIALFIFAHGAGADKSHQYLETVTELLNAENINVVRFNFPYMDKRLQDGKKYPPNRMPILIPCYQQALDHYTQRNTNELPMFIGGKSMGSRVAATLAADNQDIKGVICIGYPFHPQKKPENLRLEPLQETKYPVLILQGDRDSLGSRKEIEAYDISPLCQISFYEDGDHDLKPRVKSGHTHAQHIENAVKRAARFIYEKS